MEKAFIIRNNRAIGFSDKVCFELTQAEYDILSDEKKNDGTIYFITDGTDEGFGINDGVVSDTSTWSSSKIKSEITHGVADVAITNIVLNSAIAKANGNSRYVVRNGICYVSLDFDLVSTSSSDRQLLTGLPATKLPLSMSAVPYNSSVNTVEPTMYLMLGSAGDITINNMTWGRRYLLSFSYPVA